MKSNDQTLNDLTMEQSDHKTDIVLLLMYIIN